MNTRHSLTRDPCFARDGTLGGSNAAPFIQNSHGSPAGKGGELSLLCSPPEQFAAAVTSFPAGAIDRGGASPASPVVTIDTESEPGSWADAIPYKFHADKVSSETDQAQPGNVVNRAAPESESFWHRLRAFFCNDPVTTNLKLLEADINARLAERKAARPARRRAAGGR